MKKQKTILIIAGVFFSVLIVEGAMRLAGFAISRVQEHRNQSLMRRSNIRRILCVGESTTALWGDDAYPQQLQDVLNEQSPENKFIVINQGMISGTSTNILKNMPRWIDEYQPDVVIAMIGVNDQNPLLTFTSGLNEHPYLSFITNFRVYQLFQWVKDSLGEKWKKSKDSPEKTVGKERHFNEEIFKKTLVLYDYAEKLNLEEQYEKSEKILNGLIQEDNVATLKPHIYREWLISLGGQKDYESLSVAIKKVFAQDLPFVHIIPILQSFCEDKEMAEKVLPVLTDVKGRKDNTHFLYDLLSECYSTTDDSKKAEQYKAKARKMRNNLYDPVVKNNYLKLAQLLDERDIALIAMQYPLRDVAPLKLMLKKAPSIHEIIFVENIINFRKALKKQSYEELFVDKFAGDFGHCNRKGNRIVAEHVASTVIQYFSP